MTTLHDVNLTTLDNGFTLRWQNRLILTHTDEAPCLWIGTGLADIEMFRGNFSIKDKLNEKIIAMSGCGWRPSQKITSTAVANSSRISICVANPSRCGPANRAWGVTNRRMSPGRLTVKRTRAVIITGPSSRSQPLSARKSITATLITAAI